MRDFLDKKINWIVVLTAVVVFSLFIIVILPNVSTYTKKAVGDLGSPDSSFLYTNNDLYQFAASYGEVGRRNYIVLRWTFDVVWPLAYLFFLLSITIQLSKTFTSKWLTQLYWLAIIAMGFDFLENSLVTVYMLVFPANLPWLGAMASIITLLKWISLYLAFAAIIVLGIVRFAYCFIKTK